MPNLYVIGTNKEPSSEILDSAGKFSVYYHDLFDYPLTFADLIKWHAGRNCSSIRNRFNVVCRNGHFFLQGKEGLVYKRVLRSRISSKKMEIARKASKVLSSIPTIKMVGVTGSLAMGNATDESDIDLLIITSGGSLWTTRAFAYLFIWLFGIQTRRFSDKDQKDKLCLNMWMDESDMVWRRPRNIYTAHEIGQIMPLVNKDLTYEKFLWNNRWILKYWPNVVKIQKSKFKSQNHNSKLKIIETLAFWVQYQHMRSKITRETITKTRAVFHPQDWGKVVLGRLKV